MTDKKTINIVCHYASIYGGNFIPSIIALARQLTSFKIVMTFPKEAEGRNWAKYLIDEGFTVTFIDFSNKKFKRELKRVDEQYGVNVIYTHFISGLRIKTIYPFSKRIKLVIHIHSDFTGGNSIGILARLKNFVELHLIRRDAQYIYVSESMWKKNSKNKKHHYVQNALCVDRIPGQNNNILINGNKTVYLTFGWSPYVKGVDITVKAFLNNKFENSELIVVHGRDDGYQKCIEFLKNKIGNDLFLKDPRIKFVPPIENVFDYYSAADIFISSSRSEGFSYSVLEALYFNLGIICSDIEGTMWAKKFPNVFMFKAGDNEELCRLIESNCGYKKKTEFNDRIKKEFDINVWCGKVKNILTDVN